MSALIFGIVILVIYFIPSIAAYNFNRRNRGAILALNTLLGWTLLGWVIAAIWACIED